MGHLRRRCTGNCARLKLGHAHSDSSLLTPEEADRVKADLDDRSIAQELLRRETVVETSAGKVLEKRLNATVMRRRHTEPEPVAQAAAGLTYRSISKSKASATTIFRHAVF